MAGRVFQQPAETFSASFVRRARRVWYTFSHDSPQCFSCRYFVRAPSFRLRDLLSFRAGVRSWHTEPGADAADGVE